MAPDVLAIDVSVNAGTLVVDARFDVPPGITVLFGPSGSGKTTTLRAIAGLVRPERGRVALGDEVWFDSSSGANVRPEARRLSMVFQSLSLFPHMSALENVEYGIDRGIPREQRLETARAALSRMRVAHVERQRPVTLSGGEAQRVGLARAFARNPRVVLLDEAFSAMDRELRYELGAHVRTAVAELGIPAVVVTHHRQEARSLGDRAVLLRHGRVEAVGPVADVVPAPERN